MVVGQFVIPAFPPKADQPLAGAGMALGLYSPFLTNHSPEDHKNLMITLGIET